MSALSAELPNGLIAGLPLTNDAQQALLADLQSWAEETITAPTPFGSDEIARMIVHSQHLQGVARRHPESIAPILNGNAASVIDDAIAAFTAVARSIATDGDDTKMMQAIRQLRQKTALAVALGDIGGGADMGDQMRWLSAAADAAINGTVHYLFMKASKRNLMPPPTDDLAGCGWSLLALGKLGAHELNYSSDVDLIILHDPEATPLFDPETAQSFYVDLTRSFVKLLSHATSDGIGWRVDLRLRPDPGATAVSIQREAALGYYESIARTWERAAFIRARPVGGDLQFGKDFLKEIQPFIWRRSLDYTVMDDMKMMLRRPRHGDGWAGFDLKTGENGIRKIEFLTHVLQLVAGGRNVNIRCGSTVPALGALAAADWLSDTQAEQLSWLYHALRRAEHRLQMRADAQTHSLPRGDEEMTSVAQFLGWQNADDFLRALAAHLSAIGTHASHRIFEDEAATPDRQMTHNNSDGPLSKDGHDGPMLEDEEQLVHWLRHQGFARPTDIGATLSGWMAGRIAATRGERARMLLTRLVPEILAQLATASNPDEAFAALAQFIEGLPASVQIFSLLDHNRHLTKLLCDMLVLSPRMASYLRHYPALFDLVLFEDFFAALPSKADMTKRLVSEIDGVPVEDALQTIQRHAREWRFQAEAQTLSGVADERSLGRNLSAIADSVIAVVLDLARRDMERRHGRIAGSISIVGLGRIGIQDLTAQSDLDLVAIFDVPESVPGDAGGDAGGDANGDSGSMSDGAKPLSALPYFTRLTQTFINWMGMPGVAGRFYEIDMRLRPDGDKGNIAVRLDRLGDYFAQEAWLWERLALAKARVITTAAGDEAQGGAQGEAQDNGGRALARVIDEIVAAPVDPADIADAITSMTKRLRSSYLDAPALQLRKQPGGISELDLLVQGLRLRHTSLFAGTGQNLTQITERLRDDSVLDMAVASDITEAAQLFSRLHHYLRLCLGNSQQRPDDLPHAVWEFLLAQMDMPDDAYLLAALAESRTKVEEISSTIFGAAMGEVSGKVLGE